MNCPHCGNTENRVIEVRDHGVNIRRSRLCRGCGKTFTTAERVSHYWGRKEGWVDQPDAPHLHAVAPPPPPPEQAVAAATKPRRVASRFMPQAIEDERIAVDARPLLLQWWNEARWSKHRSRATWTEAAWRASLERVALLTVGQQLALARGGVEHGWQALKPDYVGLRPAPTGKDRLMPTDPRMLEAVQWPGAAS